MTRAVANGSARRPVAAVGRHLIAVLSIGGAALILLLTLSFGAAAASATIPARPSTGDEATAPPPQIRELVTLLADPMVREWLEKSRAAELSKSSAANAEAISISHFFSSRIGMIREHMVALADALPKLPAEFQHGTGIVREDLGDRGRGKVLLHLGLFVALGFGVEWLFRYLTRRIRQRFDALPLGTVQERLHLTVARLGFAAGLVAAFALGSLGPFLVLDWAPLLREIMLGYLAAFLALRIAVVLGHFLLAPNHDRFRIIPMDHAAARFWWRRLCAFVGWFAFGWVTVGLLQPLGYSLAGRQLVAYTLGLGLLAIALEAVWRRPVPPGVIVIAEEPATPQTHRFGRGARNAALSVAIVLLWAFWVLRAMPVFWLLLVATILPLAMALACRAIEHLLRPPGLPSNVETIPSVTSVCIERGVRALLIIAAVLVLAWGWGIDLVSLGGQNTLLARLAHGALSAVIILLIADVLWHAAKAAIDRKLAEAVDPGHPNTDEARRRARMRTLLPIFRNILFVVVIAVAAMMALAAMGVEIGPLIAGAGVVGVAIGFGAQTFVRDVIAGVFYLVDDAFRVGEYIQSGNYKGTVEGFSIRSVKLRHHRGPLYTVPFGLLGAVQNQSRDWVIDKLMIGITYDSDLEKARKLIKQIGLELAQDPEFAPLILEPLKMQGVEQFGDFAVQIRMKMMTLPGEQFVIRRKAYAMIKKAFDANGIKFAFPTVQVAGDAEAPAAAIAQQGLELTRPQAAA
jgi:small-conductance mechanosensitive channel